MKTCSKCGETKPVNEFGKNARQRSGLHPLCKVCHNISVAAWKAANPEKIKAANAKWSAANPEKIKASCAKWAAANRDKKKANDAKWRSNNPEKHRATAAKSYAANRDKTLARLAKWAKANPEARRIYKQNRRARKLEAGGRLSSGLADKLFKLQRGKCACGCKQPLGDDCHMDHIHPLALGGTNTDDNIQLLRARCNKQKGAKHPIDFMRQRGFLL